MLWEGQVFSRIYISIFFFFFFLPSPSQACPLSSAHMIVYSSIFSRIHTTAPLGYMRILVLRKWRVLGRSSGSFKIQLQKRIGKRLVSVVMVSGSLGVLHRSWRSWHRDSGKGWFQWFRYIYISVEELLYLPAEPIRDILWAARGDKKLIEAASPASEEWICGGSYIESTRR